jgi:hypothetical protein
MLAPIDSALPHDCRWPMKWRSGQVAPMACMEASGGFAEFPLRDDNWLSQLLWRGWPQAR